MQAIQRPSTPAAQTSRSSTPASQRPSPAPQPGSWTHPRFDEIARRQNAATFTDRNVRRIIYNAGSWIAVWAAWRYIPEYSPKFLHLDSQPKVFARYVFSLLQILFAINIFAALMPVIGPKDDLSDIPLTPAQRKLLGLKPTSTPPTPGSTYSTPPRYARTPLSGSPASRASDGSYSASPLSRKASPSSLTMLNNSDFSPNASPLLQKAVSNGSRRGSYGSPSPLGMSVSRLGEGKEQGTPSPLGATGRQKGASVWLSQKWLYDKRRGSGNSRLFS